MIPLRLNSWLIVVGALFLIANSLLYIYKDFYLFNLLPIALLAIYALLFKLDYLFLFIAFFTPLSINLEDLGGLGIYLPTEPLLVLVMFIFLYKQIKGNLKRDVRIVNHPISIAIYFHLSWLFITALTSELPIVSFKFLLMKLWFFIPCYFFGIWVFRKDLKNTKRFLWAYILPLTFVLVFTLIKHSLHGFSEEIGHWIMSPFFKDHTSYGAIIALFYPVLLFFVTDKDYSPITRGLIFMVLIIFTIALFYSYTRAAWLSIVAAGGVYLLFVFKIKFSYLITLVGITGIFIAVNFTEIQYMLRKNDAEHTTEDFSERIESMSNVSSDASNLERLNRWNSAIKMFVERPLVGWGPGTYALVYAPFQAPEDKTIISTNFGDGGNAHSEYLGPLCEQGVPGLLTTLWLVFAIFYTASNVYLRLTDEKLKRLVMMLLLSLVTYFTHGILNNYLDTDKAAVPIWSFVAMIVVIDVYHSRKEKQNALEEPAAE
jgi:putative inorganic carbon (hco3(-)) transporter